MTRYVQQDVGLGYATPADINIELTKLETAINDTLSRVGDSPNTMNAELDMNSNKIINLASPTASADAARFVDVTAAVSVVNIVAPALTGNAGKVLTVDPAETTTIWSSTSTSAVVFNVLDQGAIGDGVADDTSAIQTAMNLASTAKGICFFPTGTYLVTAALNLKSDTQIIGDGMFNTTITLQQSNITTPNFSMFESVEALVSNSSFFSIGLRGNRAFQTTVAVDSSYDLSGLAFDGTAFDNFTMEKCHIREFGDSSSVGGAAAQFVPRTGTANSNLHNMYFRHNLIGPNNNVPGIYVQPYLGTSGTAENIYFFGNTFKGGGDQNCIYMLGDSGNLCKNVIVSGNSFDIVEDIDSCVEFNGVRGGVIDNNVFRATSTGSCLPILIRGGGALSVDCDHIAITNNTLVNENTTDKDGIALISFSPVGQQRLITIMGNTIKDFGGGTKEAIKLGVGTILVNVSGNLIDGSSKTLNKGIGLSEVDRIVVTNNIIRKATNGFVLASGSSINTASVLIRNNIFNDVGSSGNAMNGTTGGTINLTNVSVIHNVTHISVAGTASFCNFNVNSAAGNRIYDNQIDSNIAKEVGDLTGVEAREPIVIASTTSQIDITSTTYSDTNLTANITPRDLNDIIEVDVTQAISILGGTAQDVKFRVLRGATVIYENVRALGNGVSLNGSIHATVYDSPASTSAQTYKTQIAKDAGGGANLRAQNASSESVIGLTRKSAT